MVRSKSNCHVPTKIRDSTAMQKRLSQHLYETTMLWSPRCAIDVVPGGEGILRQRSAPVTSQPAVASTPSARGRGNGSVSVFMCHITPTSSAKEPLIRLSIYQGSVIPGRGCEEGWGVGCPATYPFGFHNYQIRWFPHAMEYNTCYMTQRWFFFGVYPLWEQKNWWFFALNNKNSIARPCRWYLRCCRG